LNSEALGALVQVVVHAFDRLFGKVLEPRFNLWDARGFQARK
jgi:hypothetical protein